MTARTVARRPPVGDPGLAIHFVLNCRSLAMVSDCFDGAAANMRLPGLAIDAMRQLERRGGAMMERAFSGFAALLPARMERSLVASPALKCRTSSGRFAARPRSSTPTWAARPPPWQSSTRPGHAPSEIEV